MKDSLVISQQELEGIYTSAGSDALPGQAERRTAVRWPFSEMQLLGPYGSWGLPRRHMFKEIRCHDISQGGVSFFLPGRPDFDFAVVGLGKRPNLTYFLLRVTYCKENADAKNGCLVGGRFLQRVKIES